MGAYIVGILAWVGGGRFEMGEFQIVIVKS